MCRSSSLCAPCLIMLRKVSLTSLLTVKYYKKLASRWNGSVFEWKPASISVVLQKINCDIKGLSLQVLCMVNQIHARVDLCSQLETSDMCAQGNFGERSLPKPLGSWIKLNKDESSLGNPGRVGADATLCFSLLFFLVRAACAKKRSLFSTSSTATSFVGAPPAAIHGSASFPPSPYL
ncbi:hypothetical protein NE237_001039 [Protea cynaroides]|uniref:Uncharacterized protein n=1 Tax=Protea cynaroides TaxID=273540 RepID=A0A9Q0KS96_9MAGN|nr:hypothetical protein NE237_001039 [Protea cynaroides]